MRKINKIVLISPTSTRPGLISRFFRFPPLNLALLAALAPEYNYKIIDENIDSIDFNSKEIKEADLIGLTVMTVQAPRAYQLADKFRKMGKTVIMGGMHVSAIPEEAIKHCDAVVVGEAEGLWPELLKDYEKGKLKKIYENKELSDLSDLPIPRRELLRRKNYIVPNTLQASRGCPFNCSFCAVSRFFGKKYRLRPVEEVIEEIKKMVETDKLSYWRKIMGKFWNKMNTSIFAFLDDNIFGQADYARKLFKALIPLKIFWGAQTSVNIARPENEDLLELAAKSGCKFVFVGLESINQSSLDEATKKVNKPEMYAKAVELFHKYGISVLGAFIFGFDSDDKSIFKRTVDFAKRIKLDLAQFAVLTPLPGTRLMEKLKKEGRIVEKDWSMYDFGTPVFKPSKMSAEDLMKGEEWAIREFYSWSSILRRLPPLSDWSRLILYLVSNVAYRIQSFQMLDYKKINV